MRVETALMAKATWNGKVIAESDTYETVEGNIYFPDTAIRREYFRPSSTISTCPWKGQARYYSLLVDGQETRTLLGTIPIPSRPLATSRIISLSGVGLRSRSSPEQPDN